MGEKEVPEFVESIAEHCYGRAVGISDDGNRFGVNADKVESVATNLAMRNGYVVDKVRPNGHNSDYDLHITFTRMGFDS